MKEVPVWTCAFEAARAGGAPEHLTVGDKFRMNCHGDIAVAWTAATPTVKMPKPEQDFTLVVLNAEKLAPQSVQLTVTGYRPGEHAPDFVRILQGEQGFETEKPRWAIESVLPKDQQPPEAYPSEGPWRVLPPLWVVTLLLLLGVLLVAAGVIGARRFYRRRRFKAEILRHQTALAPVRQFYRDARGLRRRLDRARNAPDLVEIARDLDRDVRLLLLREYAVPTIGESERAILAALSRTKNAAPTPLLKKLLRELGRALTRPTLSSADVDQILRMAIDVAEGMERSAR